MKKRGGGGGNLAKGGWVAGGNFQMENTHLSLSVYKTNSGALRRDRKLLLLLARQVELCTTLAE